ncbi:tripartite tricarboxylate transporter substrate binding protein [Comamonas sp. Z3]|uniref:Bug family tripartite tricarboxylate transporter substrate binding protein n=1 Tax=Comamonas sp. Z3 TaxID=2601247 RepID=UPI0011E66059|nr:tripartite tricarboxylate transporter substrate binding protein [Comamonas sp. Z3]TYK68279.1 tripartite tricarboxylate transporter substrate binding protein [Comamonas sp. Z3]
MSIHATGRASRRLGAVAAFCLAVLSLAAAAQADSYPGRQIKIVVPFTAGSATDTAGRVLAHGLSARLGVPVVIDNKAGAGGTIGSASVAAAAPDGYTLVLTSSSTHSAAGALIAKVPYDGTEDFVHITRIASIPMMLVARPGLKVDSVAALQELSKQQPLSYAYGSAAARIAAATFNALAGVKALGVPYKSQPPAVTDLLGGQVDFLFADLSVVKSFVHSERLRGLAVSAPGRLKEFPNVPTLPELGYRNFDLVVWVGLAAPKGTPASVIAKLAAEAKEVLHDPHTVSKLSAAGMSVSPNSLGEHRKFAVEQKQVWMQRAEAAGVKPE